MRRAPPLLVLAAATLLTGAGQVLNREPSRGLAFAVFALILGAATVATAPPEASFVGRIAGGLFVHAMAMLDAYRRARLREARRQAPGQTSGQTSGQASGEDPDG